MTTIFVINAVSSLLAAAGLGSLVVWKRRQAAAVQLAYLTTATTRPLPHD